MKVKIKIIDENQIEKVQFEVHKVDEHIQNMVDFIKQVNTPIVGKNERGMRTIYENDILYIDTVDKKTFIYTKDDVLSVNYRLYELEEKLSSDYFLRISKSIIVNIAKVERLAPTMSGRIETILKNGEKIIISRKYVKEFKLKLGIKKR